MKHFTSIALHIRSPPPTCAYFEGQQSRFGFAKHQASHKDYGTIASCSSNLGRFTGSEICYMKKVPSNNRKAIHNGQIESCHSLRSMRLAEHLTSVSSGAFACLVYKQPGVRPRRAV